MDTQSFPIAIVGIGCRFPGQSDSPEGLWKLAIDARNTWSTWPASRLNESAFYHPQVEHLGTFHSKGAQFLTEDVSRFDASFFNISAEMARSMDPQVRILLETAFEAFESAGLPIEKVAGSRTAVFAGALFHDYNDILMMDVDNLPRYAATGNGPTMIANRISHFFDLRGTSITVDTACSTAMAALHIACQSLQSGDAEMAVVGGTNLLLHPGASIGLSTLGFLGASGKSYSFDSRADGYGRGEGVGCLIVKPLTSALRDGDPIRAIIRGTGMNQDGQTPTISSPSQEAQEELIRQCYKSAGLDPKDTPYVEAHGTGTITGDKTEASAIGNVFGQAHPSNQPVIVGSIKANIGHAEAASGVAAIAKIIKMFENECIPPLATFDNPNPQIDFESLNITIPSKVMSWPEGFPRRASVANFGVGGSNTHAILEDPRYYLRSRQNGHAKYLFDSDPAVAMTCTRFLFAVSNKDKSSLEAYLQRLPGYLEDQDSDKHVPSLAHTLTERRSHFAWRTAFVSSTIDGMLTELANPSIKRASGVTKLGFVFTGQGAQWHRMGYELIEAYPSFARSIAEADHHLRSLGASWSIVEEIAKDNENSQLHFPYLSFPVTVILQMAVVRLLGSWGIHPLGTTGHSSGEIAAAYTAGALTFEEAISVAYFRGRITSKYIDLKRLSGAMASLGIGEEAALELLGQLGSTAVIACVNSPSNVTISGDIAAIKKVEEAATPEGVFFRILKVPAAYHSQHMEPLAGEYARALEEYLTKSAPEKPHIRFSSPVTGKLVDDVAELRDPLHWVRNMTQPVLFQAALQNLILDEGVDATNALGIQSCIEIGPHGALQGIIQQILREPVIAELGITVDSCLKRNTNPVQTTQEAAGRLYCQGYPVDFHAINFPTDDAEFHVIRSLPHYQWNHLTKYWAESSIIEETLYRKHAPHDLLGVMMPGINPKQYIWRNIIRLTATQWFQDHAVQSQVLFPGVGFGIAAIEASRQLDADDVLPNQVQAAGQYVLRDVDMSTAIVIPNQEHGLETQIMLEPANSAQIEYQDRLFSFYSRTKEGRWTKHCTGVTSASPSQPTLTYGIQNAADLVSVDPAHFYSCFAKNGPTLGKSFQNITELRCGNGSAIAKVTIPNTSALAPYTPDTNAWFHPAVLDSCFQVAWAAVPDAVLEQMGVCVLRFINSMFLNCKAQLSPGAVLDVHATVLKMDASGFDFVLSAFQMVHSGLEVVINADRVTVQSLSPPSTTSTFDNSLILKPVWQPDITLLADDNLGSALNLKSRVPPALLREASIEAIRDTLSLLSPEDKHSFSPKQHAVIAWLQKSANLIPNGQSIPNGHAKLNGHVDRIFNGPTKAKSSTSQLLSQIPALLARHLGAESDFDVVERHNLLRDYYEEVLDHDSMRETLKGIAKLCAHKTPNCRVLEIGAGHGATTFPIIQGLWEGNPACTNMVQYHFTDKFGEFLEPAKARLHQFQKHLDFKVLDIDYDPFKQGFEAEEYDLVVVGNVLYESTDPVRALKHIRKVVRAGGTLVLTEMTTLAPEYALPLSISPGWWLTDKDEWPPIFSAERWSDLLSENGFGVQIRGANTQGSGSRCTHTVIVAEAVVPDELQEAIFPSQTVLFQLPGSAALPSEFTMDLGQRLHAASGTSVSVHTLGSDSLLGKACIILAERGENFLSDLSQANLAALQRTVQAATHLMWVSRGAVPDDGNNGDETSASPLLQGLFRTLRLEERIKIFVSLDLDNSEELWSKSAIGAICATFRSSMCAYSPHGKEYEFSQRGNQLWIPRMTANTLMNKELSGLRGLQVPQDENFNNFKERLRLDMFFSGSTDNICFKKSSEKDWNDESIEIRPQVFGVNDWDSPVETDAMQLSSGGFECVGYINRVGAGVPDRFQVGGMVAAIVPQGTWSNKICVPWESVIILPVSFSSEIAVSSIDLATSWLALADVYCLDRVSTIIIHGAGSAFGQAVLVMSQYIGAKALAVVSNPAEQTHLMDKCSFPSERILVHSDGPLDSAIWQAIPRDGVDVIVDCSVYTDLPRLEPIFLAPFGRFIQITSVIHGKDKSPTGVAALGSLSYTALDIGQLRRVKYKSLLRRAQEVIRLIHDGKLQSSVPVNAFTMSECIKAFQFVQAGYHGGKVVVQVGETDVVKVVASPGEIQLQPSAAYLVVGGLGGLGLEAALYLARRGAKKLILISRTAEAQATKALRDEFLSVGTELLVRNCDVSQKHELEKFVEEYRQHTCIRGIIQAAAVLQDSLFSKMTIEQWQTMMLAKKQGTKNLDELFRGSEVDFFIIISSLTAVVGNVGQANYTAAGAYQDAVAHHRVARGLPGVSINIGSVPDLGFAFRSGVGKRLHKIGCRHQKRSELLHLVALAIKHPKQAQIVTGIEPWTETANIGWREETKFACAHMKANEFGAPSSSQKKPASTQERLSGLDKKAATVVLAELISEQISTITAMPKSEIDPVSPLSGFGIDSLVAVELRALLQTHVTPIVTIFDITQSATLLELAGKLMERMVDDE